MNQKTAVEVTAREKADETFKYLREQWENGLDPAIHGGFGWLWKDFWKGGNTLDAYVNYLVIANETDEDPKDPNDPNKRNFIAKSLEFFKKKPYPSGHWLDDWAWWGNAFVNAYNHADDIGAKDQKEACLQAAKYSWDLLYANAVKNRKYGDNDQDKIPIGAGYAAWNNKSAEDYNPKDCPEVPNTVTNAGFWALSIGLWETTGDKKYRQSIMDTFGWFHFFWLLNNGGPSGNENLFFNKQHLVRETVNPWTHNPWCTDDRNRAWTADQGVMLYVLWKTRSIATDDRQKENLSKMFEQLYGGFITEAGTDHSKNSLIHNFVLNEFKTDDKAKGDHGNFNCNYSTGPGVFMRYVAKLVQEERKEGKDNRFYLMFHPFVVSSSESAWKYRDGGQIGSWWSKPLNESVYKDEYPLPDVDIWRLALQVSGLDLFVAEMIV
jgi:hypothetical protein